jgi:hypothetical protein
MPAILLNRQSNLIAMRTRRGAGNLAFMSPMTLNTLIAIQCSTSVFAWNNADDRTVGRWTNVGTMNNNLTLYTSPHMPEMEVVTLYRGNGSDVGAVLLDRDDGLTLIDDVGRADISTSSVSNYLTRVRFREPERRFEDFTFPPSVSGRGSLVERLPA